MKTKGFLIGMLAAAASALGGGAEEAMATTFCVPNLAACPGVSGAVAKADLEEAMSVNSEDGVADQVIIGAGTFSDSGGYEPEPGSTGPFTFETKGSDPLTVTGAGRSATFLTSVGTENIYVVNLSYNNSRKTTLRNLTVRIPASFPDSLGNGAGILMEENTLEDVDLVSLNPDADGITAVGPSNVVRRFEARGEGANGSLFYGLHAYGSAATNLLAEDVSLKGAAWALYVSDGANLTARRVQEFGTGNYGAIVTQGAASIQNSVFRIDDGITFYVSAGANPSTVTADHLTVLNSGTTYSAFEVLKSSGAGTSTVEVANSIMRGFASGYKIVQVAGPGVGKASLKARYSNLLKTGTLNGGSVDLATGNIDADPKFNADLSLPPASPSVDAGDTLLGLNTDIVGAPRPVDGNGDGIVRRDQGAFEYQIPVPPSTGGGSSSGAGQSSAPLDTVAPQAKLLAGPGKGLGDGNAKFRFNSSEKGSTFTCKLDQRKPKPCQSPKSYTGLKPGRHVFKVWATHAAGNKSAKPAKRRFRVPA